MSSTVLHRELLFHDKDQVSNNIMVFDNKFISGKHTIGIAVCETHKCFYISIMKDRETKYQKYRTRLRYNLKNVLSCTGESPSQPLRANIANFIRKNQLHDLSNNWDVKWKFFISETLESNHDAYKYGLAIRSGYIKNGFRCLNFRHPFNH